MLLLGFPVACLFFLLCQILIPDRTLQSPADVLCHYSTPRLYREPH